MKKYEYVTVHAGTFVGASFEEHRDVIDRYAAQGWRYVGFIPVNMDGYGRLRDMDLVFETDL